MCICACPCVSVRDHVYLCASACVCVCVSVCVFVNAYLSLCFRDKSLNPNICGATFWSTHAWRCSTQLMARNHIGSRRGHRQCAVLHSFLGGEHVRRRLHVVLDKQDKASSQHQWPDLPSTADPACSSAASSSAAPKDMPSLQSRHLT